MRRSPTPKERRIAETLGITDAQLFGLLEVKARRASGNVGHHLQAKGLVTRSAAKFEGYVLTPAGEALLGQARAMGY